MRYYDADHPPEERKSRRRGCGGGVGVALLCLLIYGVVPGLLPFQFFTVFGALFIGGDPQAVAPTFQLGQLVFSLVVLLIYFWAALELIDRYQRVMLALFLLPFSLSLLIFYPVLNLLCRGAVLPSCAPGASLSAATAFDLYRFYLVVFFATGAAYVKRWADARQGLG